MYICLVKFTGYFNVYGVITRVTIEDDRQGRANNRQPGYKRTMDESILQ